MECIVCNVVSIGSLPFVLFSLFTNLITTRIVRRKKYVLGVPSYIPLEFSDFIRHFGILTATLCTNVPRSLGCIVEGQSLLCGYSCRALFETSLMVLKKHFKGRPLKIVTTPIHHKSFVDIMEKHVDSFEFLQLDGRMREIVIDERAEAIIKSCDVIVVTHLFGRTLDLGRLIEIKNRYSKILIVDSVMGGARAETHGMVGVDLDLYSTGQDKRPVALGGGYCLIRHPAFQEMEKEILSYRVVSRWERFCKISNTFVLRQLHRDRPLHLAILAMLSLTGGKLSVLTASIRKSNPGFDHDNFLLCPNESMLRSIRRELPNIREMEFKYNACWKTYLQLLPCAVRQTFYPFYSADEDIILPYHQILLPPSHEGKFLSFCDEQMIGCVPNQNYKCMRQADECYHDFVQRIVNCITVIRPLEEIPFLVDKLTKYHREFCAVDRL